MRIQTRISVEVEDHNQDPTAGSLVEGMLNQIFRAIEENTEVEQFRQLSHLTCECLRYE
jgi:hypothetical protein